MSEPIVLNTAWLAELPNAQHDGTTQQICDYATAFQTQNARYLAKVATVVERRQTEDDVWLTVQRDPAAKSLEGADRQQDSYVTAARYINLGYTSLPDDEPQKAEAVECEQVFKDYKFSTRDPYGAEADKIIQMQQNFQQHEAFLTQIGAWQWYQKAVAAAQLVRQCLGARALTMAEFVKGEMKSARRATDLAIADLYTTIMAMDDLMPSPELTALITQLKGIELYARKYILKEGSSASEGDNGNNGNTTNGSNGNGSQQGGTTPAPDDGGGFGGSDLPVNDDPDDPANNGGQGGQQGGGGSDLPADDGE